MIPNLKWWVVSKIREGIFTHQFNTFSDGKESMPSYIDQIPLMIWLFLLIPPTYDHHFQYSYKVIFQFWW